MVRGTLSCNLNTVAMGKSLLLLLSFSFFSTFWAFSQITYKNNCIRSGDEIIKEQVEFKDPGRSGENVIWNFSELKAINSKYKLSFHSPCLINDSIYIMGCDTLLKENSDINNLIIGKEHSTMYYYQVKNDTLFCLGHENPITLMHNTIPFPLMILPCIDSVLQVKCGTKESMKLVNVRDYMELVKRNEKIKEWLSGMNEDELSVYTINNNVVKYLILSSTMIDATGLATNFYHWLFIDVTNEKVLEETLSLSKDRRSCFVEDNIIHFIVFKYGDEFYHGNRDYLNLPITTVEYIWDGNKLEKISSMNLICSEER